MSKDLHKIDIDTDAVDIRLGLEIVRSVQSEHSREEFLESVFPILLALVGAEGGGLVTQQDGTWHPEVWIGPAIATPVSVIAEAVDTDTAVVSDRWYATPIRSVHRRGVAVVVVRLSEPAATAFATPSDGRQRLEKAVGMFGFALDQLETRAHHQLRIAQLTAILSAAAAWQRLDEDENLLRAIADTATELLDCERASIFLWDKRRRKLIGRPALGVDNDTLEVPDDSGVVGEVLRTSEAKIWNSGSDDESRINRTIDQSLEFETRSLVAVPMAGGHGDLIGVFEAINRRQGGFDAGDATVLDDLTTHAAAAIEGLRKRQQLTRSRDRLVDDAASSTPLIGQHASIDQVRQRAEKIARTDLSVLVLGENGTGKEVLARHIHYESQRRSGPFIAVNCAALVETLLESELFGHEKGAFTDANQTRVGKFELASGGTLFLDEVGDMSLSGQAKLLRVLEEKVVVRVGGSQTIPVDVRVIAATNQPLEELIEQRLFREDLFFRLNVVSLTLPSLADRGDDVLLLTEHFMSDFCYQIGRQIPTLQPCAQLALRKHGWPGNIRELRNTIERVCYLCTSDTVTADDLSIDGLRDTSRIGGLAEPYSDALTDATKEFQVRHIERAIELCQGNMTDAAAMLGLHRSNLYRKMRQLECNRHRPSNCGDNKIRFVVSADVL